MSKSHIINISAKLTWYFNAKGEGGGGVKIMCYTSTQYVIEQLEMNKKKTTVYKSDLALLRYGAPKFEVCL